jgi:SRSO17 transposase
MLLLPMVEVNLKNDLDVAETFPNTWVKIPACVTIGASNDMLHRVEDGLLYVLAAHAVHDVALPLIEYVPAGQA